MTFKEFVRFTYGLFMGTSTPWLKPSQRYLFPIKRLLFDSDLGFLFGGSCVSALLAADGEKLVVNANQAGAAKSLRKWADEKSGDLSVILSSASEDFSKGLEFFADAKKIYVGRGDVKLMRKTLGAFFDRVIVVDRETTLDIAGEELRLIPLGSIASNGDLAVYLESRSVLFLGALYYNEIHPILRASGVSQVELWAETVSKLLERFEPKVVVAGEGEISTSQEARAFISYLRDLSNKDVEFARCRELYDWTEIPSHTSLEENFDLLRENKQNFTTLN